MTPEYRPFPKGLYNKDGVLKIVQSQDELDLLWSKNDDWRYGPDGKLIPHEKPRSKTEEKSDAKAKDK